VRDNEGVLSATSTTLFLLPTAGGSGVVVVPSITEAYIWVDDGGSVIAAVIGLGVVPSITEAYIWVDDGGSVIAAAV
jgi:hypothetical protein